MTLTPSDTTAAMSATAADIAASTAEDRACPGLVGHARDLLDAPAGPQPRGDAWMLPDDGIIDPIAVEIAAKGERRVKLTAAERSAAAEIILARGGTVAVIAARLCMSDSAASALAYVIRNGYTRTPDREAA